MRDSWPIVVGLVVLIGVAMVMVPFGDVTRKRVEHFAYRQALPVTVTNGSVVIAYLATTRRWRASGLILSTGVAVVYAWLNQEGIRLNAIAAFAGWFVGAIVAEWRIAGVARGEQRGASLHRRRLEDYLLRRTVVLPALIWVAVGSLGVGGWLDAMVGDRAPIGALSGEVVGLVLVGAVIVVAARRVLQRPQPLAEPDVLAADDALRGRSLHVLAGAALAIAGYLGASVLSTMAGAGLWISGAAAEPFEQIGVVLLPLAGAMVAVVGRRPIVRRAVAVARS